MAYQAPFKQRVAIPLAVIVGTVGLLAGGGTLLLKLKSGSPASTTTTTSTGDSFVPDPNASVPAMYMHVQVLNGTTTAGLARKTADSVASQGWVIATIGNYSGAKLEKSVVYYPEGFEKQAEMLAELAQADTAPATADLSKKYLTLVVATGSSTAS